MACFTYGAAWEIYIIMRLTYVSSQLARARTGVKKSSDGVWGLRIRAFYPPNRVDWENKLQGDQDPF
jgi:hypothetical protein